MNVSLLNQKIEAVKMSVAGRFGDDGLRCGLFAVQ